MLFIYLFNVIIIDNITLKHSDMFNTYLKDTVNLDSQVRQAWGKGKKKKTHTHIHTHTQSELSGQRVEAGKSTLIFAAGKLHRHLSRCQNSNQPTHASRDAVFTLAPLFSAYF